MTIAVQHQHVIPTTRSRLSGGQHLFSTCQQLEACKLWLRCPAGRRNTATQCGERRVRSGRRAQNISQLSGCWRRVTPRTGAPGYRQASNTRVPGSLKTPSSLFKKTLAVLSRACYS